MPVPSDAPAYRGLAEWVSVKILEAIRQGALASGETLVERDVATRLGVSRAPVRDAFKRLESLGVVERDGSRNLRVRQWTPRDSAEVWLLFDALILLSVLLATGRVDQTRLAELEEILEQTRHNAEQADPDIGRQFELNMRFHLALGRASGHRRLLELMEGLVLPLELWPTSFEAHKHPSFQLRQHLRLLEVIRSGDRNAALSCVLSNIREDEDQKLRALFAGRPGSKAAAGAAPPPTSATGERPPTRRAEGS
ncbi:MAG: GntR family transcriptional regulator [Geminicoccaceae bacterium]